ncbi:hypothetical protein ACFX15_030634 [Malus domestica]
MNLNHWTRVQELHNLPGLLKSRTTTLILLLLCLAKDNFINKMDASKHALSDLASASRQDDAYSEAAAFCASKNMRTTPQAVSFDTTSQRPLLARIRHSSSAARSVTVTSGSDVTYGFR